MASPRPPASTILLLDEHFVVVDKPSGLPSARDRWDAERLTVIDRAAELVAEATGAPARARSVHRIDRQTSGVILVALTAVAGRELSRQFRDREVEKRYLALVAGAPPAPAGTIDVRLDADPQREGTMRAVRKRGKAAVTEWRERERFRGFALVEARPRTGRTHQIRVHLAHAGMPLAIDPIYGGARTGIFLSEIKRRYVPNRTGIERPLIDRLTLHAEALVFRHPATGERVEVVAPLPRDLATTLRQLRRHAAVRPATTLDPPEGPG